MSDDGTTYMLSLSVQIEKSEDIINVMEIMQRMVAGLVMSGYPATITVVPIVEEVEE